MGPRVSVLPYFRDLDTPPWGGGGGRTEGIERTGWMENNEILSPSKGDRISFHSGRKRLRPSRTTPLRGLFATFRQAQDTAFARVRLQSTNTQKRKVLVLSC
jgi:hypothetical protein